LRLKPKKYRRLVLDAETDGLLHEVTVCHCIIVEDFDTGQVWKFRKNKREDTIEKALDLLDQAEEIWGHNIIGYDLPMLEILFGYQPTARVRDSLVLARLMFPDQKDKDFRLFEAGKLDGALIGKHKLEAWGQRVGLYKGDYKKKREEEGIARGIKKDTEQMRFWVWGTWTEELEAYCVNDVKVTVKLIQLIETRQTSPEAIYVQHRLADLMARQQETGFMFDVERGTELANELTEVRESLVERLLIEFPGRLIPTKRMDVKPIGRCAQGGEFPDFGYVGDEDEDRRWYGVPECKKKASLKYKDPLRPRYVEGAWFTPIKWQEFNPRSRPQITDRLQEMGWEPTDEDYTEKGNVKANDVILRRIIPTFPVAEPLADLMAVNKLMGQLADGKQAWLKQADECGFIHGYVDPCGAVTTRATHSFPNMAQIPAIKTKKVKLAEIQFGTEAGEPVSGARAELNGLPILIGKVKEDEATVKLLGLRGGWGYESRSLFGVPEGFMLTGADLAGIELRCLAHRMAAYDGGAYGRILLEGDIHSENQRLAELDSRDTAKTFIYAFLYGAGDEKIGSIVNPLAPPHVQAKIGKELKARFLRNLPALNKVIRNCQRDAARKYITGIDGRRLFVRSKHAALNTDLQGMGATIANWWLILIEDMLTEEGLEYGWNADYTFCAWVHDEVQIAARDGLQKLIEQVCVEAAAQAGKQLNFALPVEASAVSGINWAQTH